MAETDKRDASMEKIDLQISGGDTRTLALQNKMIKNGEDLVDQTLILWESQPRPIVLRSLLKTLMVQLIKMLLGILKNK